jgi:hypothetical protein
VEGACGCPRCWGHTKKAHVPHAQRDTPRPQPRCCACGQHARTPTTAALGGQVLSLSRFSRPAVACRPYATPVARPAGYASSHTPTAGGSAHRPLAAMRPHPTAGNARLHEPIFHWKRLAVDREGSPSRVNTRTFNNAIGSRPSEP